MTVSAGNSLIIYHQYEYSVPNYNKAVVGSLGMSWNVLAGLVRRHERHQSTSWLLPDFPLVPQRSYLEPHDFIYLEKWTEGSRIKG